MLIVQLSHIFFGGSVAFFIGFWLAVVVAWLVYVPKIVKHFQACPFWQFTGYAPIAGGANICFPMDDGTVLRGTYLASATRQPRGLVLFCHGLAENRWGVVPLAETLMQHGFDLVTFDFRNHGESRGESSLQPTPWLTERELRDVCTIVNQLHCRFEAASSGIALIGMSKGANAALCAAARLPFIRAVVADGAFPLDALQRYYIRRFMRVYVRIPLLDRRLPDVCFVSFCKWAQLLYRLQSGARLVKVEHLVRRITQSVFMIHGERDSFVPPSLGHALHRQLPEPGRFWVVPGVKHNAAIDQLGTCYNVRVVRFLMQEFQQDEEHEPLEYPCPTVLHDLETAPHLSIWEPPWNQPATAGSQSLARSAADSVPRRLVCKACGKSHQLHTRRPPKRAA